MAFCLLFLVLLNFGHAQKTKFQVNVPAIFTMYFLASCYFLFLFLFFPLFTFSWAFTTLHLEGKVSMKTRRIVKLFERRRWIEWSKTLTGIFCPTLHVFFGILLHLFNWIVLIFIWLERWLIHKLGVKVVYDH